MSRGSIQLFSLLRTSDSTRFRIVLPAQAPYLLRLPAGLADSRALLKSFLRSPVYLSARRHITHI